ncbi:hypothetical protein R3W88_024979 [Solanum pinnatisectum]|uniref:Pectinesterase catalytic domain-containing protein n=1 Tax=Solanum pinnatisectum TaxID=50273 RepID=A0AAV9M245_9SOLN|nr:hypothetical protein R3W88_024979 [Solanum pinnatisectum]
MAIVILLLYILQCGGCQNISHPPNVIVAKDGSRNYNTIMAAVLASPNNRIYEEYVQIDSWKTNIVFIGEGMDKTIISGNKSYGGGIGTYDTATVGVDGKGFMAQDIAFRNTAGAANFQAVASRASAEFTTFYRCQFDGKQFYRECIILGTIDFICRDATAIFQSCQYIAITAQQTSDNGATGLILQNCTLRLATPDAGDNVAMYLGRPWGNFSRTVIMQSYIDMLINPRGWIEFEGKSIVQPYYLEYQNKGVGADTKRRVKWASATNDPRIVSNFTVRNFINGDKWIPSTIPHYLDLL